MIDKTDDRNRKPSRRNDKLSNYTDRRVHALPAERERIKRADEKKIVKQ